MTYSELFSKRYSLRPTPEGLMYEEVPERARVGLYHIVEQFFYYELGDLYLKLNKNICVALRIPRDRGVIYNYEASSALEQLIMNCEWWQFYDTCDVMWAELETCDKDKFSTNVNTLFREEQLGFELRDGKVEKIGSGFIDAKVKEARYLLKEPEFKGADKQFEKAIGHLNKRPNPDAENCVKDAVGAIESIGRIIINDEKALLSDIIKNLTKEKVIPKPLDQVFQKIYAYRGDAPGAGHGLVGSPKVTVDEAELILAMSAATIIYLVKKRGKA